MRIASITKDKELEVVGEVIEYPAELIGGRNLLRDSNNALGTWYAGSGVELTTTDGVLKGESKGNGWPRIRKPIQDTLKIELGQTYTFSFYAKSNVEATKDVSIGLANGQSQFMLFSPMITTEWGKHTYTFESTLDEIMEGSILGIYVGARGGGDFTTIVEVHSIKLEKGTKATDWAPAPEDLGLSYPDSVQYFAPSLNAERVLLPEISELDNQFSMSDKHTITHEIKEL